MGDNEFKRLCDANNRLVDVIDNLELANQPDLRKRAVGLKLSIMRVWERECNRRKKARGE